MASTDKIEAFLAEPRNVIVAGIRRDGRPQLSPNWFYWDGERFYVSTTRDRAKYAIAPSSNFFIASFHPDEDCNLSVQDRFDCD